MRVARAVVHQIELPLREPFVISYASWEAMPSVVLQLHTDDGHVGWGEAVPGDVVTGDTAAAYAQVLDHVLLAAVVGHRPADPQALHATMDARIGGNPLAKAAVDLLLPPPARATGRSAGARPARRTRRGGADPLDRGDLSTS